MKNLKLKNLIIKDNSPEGFKIFNDKHNLINIDTDDEISLLRWLCTKYKIILSKSGPDFISLKK
jgi:hypothetical protein